MFSQYIQKYYDLAINTYHINPVVYLSIYLITIPIFYLSFFYIIKELIAIKKEQGKITAKHFIYEKTLFIWIVVLAIDYLAPYLYIIFYGRNLPFWVWFVLALLILFSLVSLYKKVSKKAKKS